MSQQANASGSSESALFNPYDFVPLAACTVIVIGYLIYRERPATLPDPEFFNQSVLWGKYILMPLGNFALFLYLLLSQVVPRLKDHLQARHLEIAEGVQDFDQSSENIAARFQDTRDKLANVEEETKGIIERAEAKAAQEKQSIIAQAERQAARVLEGAEALTSYERYRIKGELEVRLVEHSFSRAAALLKENINDEDQTRLQQEHLGLMDKIS